MPAGEISGGRSLSLGVTIRTECQLRNPSVGMVAENPNGRTVDLGRLVNPTARCANSAIAGIEPAQPNYLATSRLPATIGPPGDINPPAAGLRRTGRPCCGLPASERRRERHRQVRLCC